MRERFSEEMSLRIEVWGKLTHLPSVEIMRVLLDKRDRMREREEREKVRELMTNLNFVEISFRI